MRNRVWALLLLSGAAAVTLSALRPQPRSAADRPPAEPRGAVGIPQPGPVTERPACRSVAPCTGLCQELYQQILSNRIPFERDKQSARVARCACSAGAKVAVEVGTRFGDTSLGLLNRCGTVEELHAVDPFLPNYDANDKTSRQFNESMARHGATQEGWSRAWGDAIAHDIAGVHKHGCRFRLRRGFSPAEAVHFPNQSIDFIFLDGLHTYEGLTNDIYGWLPKLRPGAIMMFNDYYGLFMSTENLRRWGYDDPWPSVKRAANDFAASAGLGPIRHLDSANGWTRLPLAEPWHTSAVPTEALDCGPFPPPKRRRRRRR